jgi:transposase
MRKEREGYPSDVSDEEWALVVSYFTLRTEAAPQREYSLRAVFNALRWLARTGAAWRMLPHDCPPWAAVYQQPQRWLKAGVFEAMVEDLRVVLRVAQGRAGQPSAAILDSRTLQARPESGHRAGSAGAQRKRGSKVHIAVATLGQVLALRVTAANEQDRAQVEALVAQVPEVPGESVEIACVDQGYTGEQAAQEAAQHGIKLEVVKLPEAKKGFVLLPRRWGVERSFAWTTRFRRLVRDYER